MMKAKQLGWRSSTACLYLIFMFCCAPAIADDEELDEAFFEFLGEFDDEDKWVDPFELENWSDKTPRNHGSHHSIEDQNGNEHE